MLKYNVGSRARPSLVNAWPEQLIIFIALQLCFT